MSLRDGLNLPANTNTSVDEQLRELCDLIEDYVGPANYEDLMDHINELSDYFDDNLLDKHSEGYADGQEDRQSEIDELQEEIDNHE